MSGLLDFSCNEEKGMAIGPPPGDPWHRRYWGYYNRPYPGCGCLWLIIILAIIWWLIAWSWTPARFGYW